MSEETEKQVYVPTTFSEWIFEVLQCDLDMGFEDSSYRLRHNAVNAVFTECSVEGRSGIEALDANKGVVSIIAHVKRLPDNFEKNDTHKYEGSVYDDEYGDIDVLARFDTSDLEVSQVRVRNQSGEEIDAYRLEGELRVKPW